MEAISRDTDCVCTNFLQSLLPYDLWPYRTDSGSQFSFRLRTSTSWTLTLRRTRTRWGVITCTSHYPHSIFLTVPTLSLYLNNQVSQFNWFHRVPHPPMQMCRLLEAVMRSMATAPNLETSEYSSEVPSPTPYPAEVEQVPTTTTTEVLSNGTLEHGITKGASHGTFLLCVGSYWPLYSLSRLLLT